MGKKGKERAKERREKRLQEISELRKVPYSPENRWWSSETVAVVTGSSRGIGFEIVRQLAEHGLRAVGTSRDGDRGREAVDALRARGLDVDFCLLDVTDEASVESFTLWLVDQHGGLDILVNNAGANFNIGPENSVDRAEEVIATNYFGVKRMMKAMIPIMRPSPHGARILNVSSRLGRANGRRNRVDDRVLRDQLMNDECLTEELIDGMVYKFMDQVKTGTWESKGWPQMYTDYSISKLAVNSYTRLMARRLPTRPQGHNIYINCYCPGWVKTAMTAWAGNVSADEGADTGVWVVLQHGLQVTGKFFAERREISF